MLHILLTAQFAQAGPLRWTDRMYVDRRVSPHRLTPITDNNNNRYPREVGTPANSDNIVSVEATAAADRYEPLPKDELTQY